MPALLALSTLDANQLFNATSKFGYSIRAREKLRDQGRKPLTTRCFIAEAAYFAEVNALQGESADGLARRFTAHP